MQPPSPTHPGRLRLRFTQLKQQAEQLAHIAAAMRTIEGVTAVASNPVTGGLLIDFEPLIGKTASFWDQVESVLLAHQLMLDPRPLGSRPNGGRATAALPREANSTDSTGSPDSTNSSDSTSPARPPAPQPQCDEQGPICHAVQSGSQGRDTAVARCARSLPMTLLERLIGRCAIALAGALF